MIHTLHSMRGWNDVAGGPIKINEPSVSASAPCRRFFCFELNYYRPVMKLIDNINYLLGDHLTQTVAGGAKLKIAASCFRSMPMKP